MDVLKIKPSPTSLEVSLDPSAGTLFFSGRSVSEHSIEFFKPILDWLETYVASLPEKTECVFKLEYFNSAARKSLVEIFKILHSVHKQGRLVTVAWHYDEGDESMKELGEEYENMFNLKFRFIQG